MSGVFLLALELESVVWDAVVAVSTAAEGV